MATEKNQTLSVLKPTCHLLPDLLDEPNVLDLEDPISPNSASSHQGPEKYLQLMLRDYIITEDISTMV